jgi:hypothetical protein
MTEDDIRYVPEERPCNPAKAYVDAVLAAHAAGTINAAASYQSLGDEVGSESYQIQEGETEAEFIERAAENDYADGGFRCALFQEIYDGLD